MLAVSALIHGNWFFVKRFTRGTELLLVAAYAEGLGNELWTSIFIEFYYLENLPAHCYVFDSVPKTNDLHTRR